MVDERSGLPHRTGSRSADPGSTGRLTSRLRRDLGTFESYAALLGILIGAGIFRVTTEAWSLTGPSVILGYIVLAPAVLATSVAYAVFLSTSLGDEPGGEYTHISRVFGHPGLAFVGTWLKVISYLGALAYLAIAFADYFIPLCRGHLQAGSRLPVALATLFFFYLVHIFGVRWFGRLQVVMFALLGASLVILIGPGLAAIRVHHYRPFFTGGVAGFASCLPPLFFAYAGFESLAQTAGEVKDSRRLLPRIFLRGTTATTAIFILISVVTFGVLPGSELATSTAPMSEVAAVYLPAAGTVVVTLGALMALATSVNATMLVPSRLAIMLAQDRLAPRWMGAVSSRTGTPIIGLTATFLIAALLLLSGQVALTLNIAVFALVILYFLHSLALLVLPRANPALAAEVQVRIPRSWQRAAALFSLVTMGSLILLQVIQDVQVLAHTTLAERLSFTSPGGLSLTSLELALAWGLIGVVFYAIERFRIPRKGEAA
ncbi:MAG: APC family permease [Acidobacteriota bacterium]